MIAGWRADWKVLCVCTDLPLAAQLHDIADIERSGPVASTLPQGYIVMLLLLLRLSKEKRSAPGHAHASALESHALLL